MLVSREVFHVEHSSASASLHRCAIQRSQIREVFHVEHPLQTTGPFEGPIRGYVPRGTPVVCGKPGWVATLKLFISTKSSLMTSAPKYVIAIAHHFALL